MRHKSPYPILSASVRLGSIKEECGVLEVEAGH